jgi:hypothetical protein
MPRWFIAAVCIVLVAGCVLGYFQFKQPRQLQTVPPLADDSANRNEPPPPPDSARPAEELPPLAETDPPAGLPINPWGRRDHFPVIRQPWFLTAKQGDTALAPDESIIGLVVGNEARAYSTNQLNHHEMVIDEIAGTPILVTY